MRAYVSGAITYKATRTDPGVLEEMVEVVEQAGYKVFCAERDTNKYELDKPDISNQDIFKKDMDEVEKSDLLVLESSNSSTGNGMEIMLAYLKDIRIILCVMKGEVISRIAQGVPNIEIVYYNDLDDLKNKLKNKL